MDNLQWIFSGIGTELLILAIGAIAGGFAIHKIVVKKSGNRNEIHSRGTAESP